MPPDSVTPRAPDPPLVDPETGETAPLSPRYRERLTLVVDPVLRRAYTEGSWEEGIDDGSWEEGPVDAA